MKRICPIVCMTKRFHRADVIANMTSINSPASLARSARESINTYSLRTGIDAAGDPGVASALDGA